MLQEYSLRSAVYRSLTRPASPAKKDNGHHSLDCQTNGTSTKHYYSTPPNYIDDPNSTPLCRRRVHAPRGLMEEAEEEESQLQLLRASEGAARELTRMIGSLSRAPHLDGRSKHVAKDLLRGARDLHSSLLMLAKLQEASKRRTKEAGIGRTARLRRFAPTSKPRRRPELFVEGMKGWIRRHGLEGHTHSAVETMVHPKRFGSRNSNFPTDESSRCCLQEEISGDDDDTTSKSGAGGLRRMSSPFELRGVSEYVEEEIGVEGRMPSKKISADSIRELRRVIADSLSRQNLLPRPSDDELESPTPPACPAAAALQPNVVAKLMGLEEAPPAREDQAERKRGSVGPRPAFDIDDRPNARKAQMPEGPNPTEKTLHEIVAAMQFNGLLRGGRGDASQFEKLGRSFREEEDAPPIVIMKPLFMPRWEETKKSNGEKAPKSIKRTDEPQKLLLAAKKEEEEEEEEERKENIRKKKIMISQANTTGSTAPYKTESKNSTSFVKENKNSTSKSVRKSTNIKSDGLKHCEDRKRNNPHEGIDSSSKTRTLIARNQDDRQETLWEATQKTNQPVKTAAARIASELEEDLTCLLLSSRSFLNHAKELFHVDAHQPPAVPPCYKRKGIGEDVMRNAKLYLDCGKELMARASREQEAFGNPMLRSPTRSSTLGRLAEEVSRAVEALTRCSESKGGGDLYRRLERDLAATASANWDVGWASSTCGEDASLVIDELGELVMSRLVAEVAQDLVWL